MRRSLCRGLLSTLLSATLWAGASGIAWSVPALDAAFIHELVSEGRHEEALERLNAYLKRDPGDARARFLRGIVWVEQNETAKAIEAFTKLTADFPNLPEPHNNLAVLYAARGEYVKARDALLVAIRTHPSYATAHENLGDIYARMAGAAYDKALQLDRKNTTAKAKLGLVHELFSIRPMGIGGAGSVQVAVRPERGLGASAAVRNSTVGNRAAMEVQILLVLEEWANAWSSQDTPQYLSFYAKDFAPPAGVSRARWEELRRRRVESPGFIEVSIGDPLVEMRGDDLAQVTFLQAYQSDVYRDEVRKSIYVKRVGQEWKIVSERTIRQP